jgi:hypothetical protein
MLIDRYTKVVLTAIAFLLAGLLFHPMVHPTSASAAANDSLFFVEPGITTLRSPDGYQQVEGAARVDANVPGEV